MKVIRTSTLNTRVIGRPVGLLNGICSMKPIIIKSQEEGVKESSLPADRDSRGQVERNLKTES